MKKILIILMVLMILVVGCSKFQKEKTTVEQNLGNSHNVFGLITVNGTPITGALLEMHLDKDPTNIVTSQSTNGYYTKNINLLNWAIDDLMIIRASYQTYIGYNSAKIIQGANQRVDIELMESTVSQLKNHTIRGKIWINNQPIKEGIVVFWLQNNPNRIILDRDLTDSEFNLYLGTLDWKIGDKGIIQVSSKANTFQTEVTIDSSFEQNLDMMVKI